MALHDETVIPADEVFGYGQLVLEVDGGKIYHPLIDMISGAQNARPGTFAPDPAATGKASDPIFTLPVDDQILLSPIDVARAVYGYGWLITAVADGWIYQLVIQMQSGKQNARPGVYVPRAKQWAWDYFTADGTAALSVTGSNVDPLPTGDPENEVKVYIGTGGRRFYDAAPSLTQHFGITGTDQIDFAAVGVPFNGEFVAVSALMNLSPI